MHKKFVIILILLFITCAFSVQTSTDNDKGGAVCIGDRRTVLRIIWSCLVMIFACTWLAVHPNVPGRNITTRGAISCGIERAKIILVTILAPEITIAWAAEQFIVAWSLRHGECFMSSGFIPIPLTIEANRKVRTYRNSDIPLDGRKGRIKADVGPWFPSQDGGFLRHQKIHNPSYST